MLSDILVEGEVSLNDFRNKAVSQSAAGPASKAPFIKADFGDLRFAELTAREI